MGKTKEKTAKAATLNTKTRPGKTDAQIQSAVLDTQKANPPGVRLATRDIEASWRASAHYIGFPDTAACKEWYWESEAARRVLEPFMESYRQHFGGTKAILRKHRRMVARIGWPEIPIWPA